MCGVAGVLRLDGTPADRGLSEAMVATLGHRGPDGVGAWARGPAALAHSRLAIIDLAGSHQPMVSGTGAVLSYNGEAFNYRQLRGRLGGGWTTTGDTEVVLRLLLEKGVRGLRDIRGQFALALWHPGEQQLVLARDALGVLPLYWWTDGRQLAFASEIKALVPAIGRLPGIDRQGLAHYLAHRSVPAPRTLLTGIRKVRPGHALRVSPSGRIIEERWVADPPAVRRRLGADDAARALDEALTEAVDLALTADVPVGAYLSGGVDSSLIAAMVRRLRPHADLHTYCATFDDPRVDEGRWGARVADHLATLHTPVPITAADFMDEWGALTRLRDAPLSEPADLAVHLLARAAARDVKVVLSGEGSDELFAGYPKYRFAKVTRAAGVWPSAARRPVLGALERRLPPSQRRMGVALRALTEPTYEERIRGWFAPFTAHERAVLVGGPAPRPERREGSSLRRMLDADRGAWLADNLLERGDRMTMGASVELRPPFLDARVVRLAQELPDSLLVRGSTTKWLVKEVAERYLPAEVVHREKSGFRVPLSSWFRGSLRDLAIGSLSAGDSFVGNHLDRSHVRTLLERHMNGVADENIRIWTLLSLEVWAKELEVTTAGCADRQSPSPAPRGRVMDKGGL
jgi:asparagine synthase (glutamine-hydrolysing)